MIIAKFLCVAVAPEKSEFHSRLKRNAAEITRHQSCCCNAQLMWLDFLPFSKHVNLVIHLLPLLVWTKLAVED